MNDIERIAAEFDRRIAARLTARQYARAIALNRAEKNPGICHTHDFCDANVFMAEALETVMGRAFDWYDDTDLDLWNRAWTAWKRSTSAHAVSV